MKHYTMTAYWGVEVYIHAELTSALVGGGWSASRRGRFTPSTHWVGGWMDPRIGVDNMEETTISPLPGLKLRPLSHPVHNHSLY
jgi:hypothetical protein